MKNPTQEILDQAVALRAKGRNAKEIMAETGLSHSQMERHFVFVDIEKHGGFLKVPESNTAWVAQIADLRLQNQSWGVIGVRYGVPESRIHRVFKESGLRSHGMRIGKGGRYLADDQRFYTGADRAKLGSELEAAKPIRDQVPTDYEAPVERKLPTLVVKPKAPRKPRASAKK